MILFPAIDIQGGKAVRLRRGEKDAVTVYADNPIELAERWRSAGADWLHIIDLDGAFSGSLANLGLIDAITRNAGIKTQIGGGIRTLAAAEKYISAGATRLIIGTAALEDPETFREMCKCFPGRIGVSLDGRSGRLQSRGWVMDAGMSVADVIPALEDAGAAFIIYTDIERDGMGTGPNLAALGDLLKLAHLPVIAAGGVSCLDDVRNISALRALGNLEGMISGRAICEGSLDLASALVWLAQNDD